MNNKRFLKLYWLPIAAGLVVLLICYGCGSASISMVDAFRVLGHQLFGLRLPADIRPSQVSILWSIRLPRVLLAFFVGGALQFVGLAIFLLKVAPAYRRLERF